MVVVHHNIRTVLVDLSIRKVRTSVPEKGEKRIGKQTHVFHSLILLSGVCICVNTILNTFFLRTRRKNNIYEE